MVVKKAVWWYPTTADQCGQNPDNIAKLLFTFPSISLPSQIPFPSPLPPSCFPDEKVVEMGPMEPDRDEVRLDPLTLPDKFIWDDINLSDDAQVSPHIENTSRERRVLSPGVVSSQAVRDSTLACTFV